MNEDIFHLGAKAIIRNKKGEILLLHANLETFSGPAPDHWDLPGGRLQVGDDIKKTLEREVEEEIGVTKISIGELLDASISKHRVNKGIFGLVVFTYLCEVENPNEIHLTDNEHTEFGWFPPKKAAEMLSIKFSDELTEKVLELT
jgi:8-oxo-dGTP pyrophosphatase MutT (NUDIX family)